MNKVAVMRAAVVLWVVFVAWSLWALLGMAPTDDGLAKGVNKIFWFLAGQAGAAACAVFLVLMIPRAELGRGEKWLFRAPALVSLIAVLGIAGIIGQAQLSKPAPDPGAGTVPAKGD